MQQLNHKAIKSIKSQIHTMRDHILVCQFDEDLVRKFHNQRLVIILSDFNQVQQAHKLVNDCQNNLHCLMIDHPGSLASIPFHEKWRGIPLALFVSEIGAFKEVMGKLPLLGIIQLYHQAL